MKIKNQTKSVQEYLPSKNGIYSHYEMYTNINWKKKKKENEKQIVSRITFGNRLNVATFWLHSKRNETFLIIDIYWVWQNEEMFILFQHEYHTHSNKFHSHTHPLAHRNLIENNGDDLANGESWRVLVDLIVRWNHIIVLGDW